jgi:hypothetical protein
MSQATLPHRVQTPPDAAPIPDSEDQTSDLPLTMTASVVLTALPRDATAALADAGGVDTEKGVFLSFLHLLRCIYLAEPGTCDFDSLCFLLLRGNYHDSFQPLNCFMTVLLIGLVSSDGAF